MCCKGSVKGEGENRLEGTRRPILLITALIWWVTLTDLDGNTTSAFLPTTQRQNFNPETHKKCHGMNICVICD